MLLARRLENMRIAPPVPSQHDPTDVAEPPSAAARLELLGRFQVVVDGQEVELAESAQRLLAFLALRARALPRLLAAGSLWPDKTDQRACANLRCSIWRARGPGGVPLVNARGPLVGLATHVAVDVREMEELGWTLVEGGDVALTRSTRQLFYEDLLPGWYDDWIVFERERLGQLRLHFLEAIAERLLAEGRRVEALDVVMHIVRADDRSERGHELLRRTRELAG
jgi:DNA-binding SARP family transcriptional activator